MEREKLKIIQPGRIGDIIICLPIAKHYYERGYEIIWPVFDEYLPLFDYVDYVSAVGIGIFDGAYRRAIELMPGCEKLDLGIGFPGHPEKLTWTDEELSFDEWKYKKADLPLELKYTLSIKRKKRKEKNLIHYLQDASFKDSQSNKGKFSFLQKYSVVHDSGLSSGIHQHNFRLPDNEKCIKIYPIEGFTVFDWLTILEGAEKIYCVDSCIANLVNQLGIGIGKRYFHPWIEYYTQAQQAQLTPKLAKGWEIV